MSVLIVPARNALRIHAPNMAQRLSVRADGFTPQDLPVPGGLEGPLEVALQPMEGFESRVTGRRTTALLDRNLSIEEMTLTPGTFGDPVRALENLPGVTRTPLGLGPIVLRGGRLGDTRTFVDGAEVPLLFHFGTLTSVVPPTMLAQADLYPGPTPTALGGSLAGAVELTSREGRAPRLGGAVDVNLAEAGVFVEGPIGGVGHFQASVRRSYFDALLPFVLQLTGFARALQVPVAPAYWDFALKGDFGQSGDALSVMFLGSDDRAAIRSRNPADAVLLGTGGFAAHVGFERLTAVWARTLTSALMNRLSVGGGVDFTDAAVGGGLFLSAAVPQGKLQDELTWRRDDRLVLTAGARLSVERQFLTASIPPLAAPGEIADLPVVQGAVHLRQTLTRFLPALWLRGVWRPSQTVKVEPSLRGDFDGLLGRFWADPALLVSWEPADAVRLRVGGGLAHQSPTIDKLLPTIGNPHLHEEQAIEATAGVDWQITTSLSLSCDLYDRELSSLAMRNSVFAAALSQGTVALPPLANTGTGRAYGAELLLRQAPYRGFFGWLAISIGESLLRPSPGAPLEPPFVSQRYNLTAVVSYEAPFGVIFGTRLRLVDGDPNEPVAFAAEFSDSENFIPVYRPLDDGDRLPPFFQWDLRVEKRWRFAQWGLTLYLDVQNVTNQMNVEGINYNYDYSLQAPLVGLPIFPTLGLRGEL